LYKLDYPFGTAKGGHAVLLLDNYPKKVMLGRTGWIYLQNSWGEDWGENGFGWIAHDYLRQRVDGTGTPYYIDGFTANYLNNRIPPYRTQLQIKNLLMTADDIPYTLDQAPFIDPTTGRTVLPLRAIAELFGSDVEWEPTNQKIGLVR